MMQIMQSCLLMHISQCAKVGIEYNIALLAFGCTYARVRCYGDY